MQLSRFTGTTSSTGASVVMTRSRLVLLLALVLALSMGVANAQVLTGTLTANLVLTVSPIAAGGYATLKFTQDSTGGRTVTVSDGTHTGVVPLPPWPEATMPDIRIYSEDGVHVQVAA